MPVTALDFHDPIEPVVWQDAAKFAVSSIFGAIHEDLLRVSEKTRIISSTGPWPGNEKLENFLESQSGIDHQFEGMINSSKWFDVDNMYWVQEWKILGALAAAAGIKNGSFLPMETPATGSKKIENFEKSSQVFDVWMVQEQITQTLIRKQHDYGHENISRFGRHGLLVRVHDKIARLKNLILNSSSPNNESISDTYTDIVGYSAIGIMWERGWFGLELTI